MDYFAHSLPCPPHSRADWEPLAAHLRSVARRGRELAAAATTGQHPLADAAEAAGLLHDLGKYRPEFQRYIRGLPPLGEKSHSQAGAARAFGGGHYRLLRVRFAALGPPLGLAFGDYFSIWRGGI